MRPDPARSLQAGERARPEQRLERRDPPSRQPQSNTGPYLLAECLFDPIDLVAAGYPVARTDQRNACRHGIRVRIMSTRQASVPTRRWPRFWTCFDLGDRFAPALVDDWQAGLFGSAALHGAFSEPAPYVMVDLHASETRYQFKKRNVSCVTDEMRAQLAREGITDIFARARNACLYSAERRTNG